MTLNKILIVGGGPAGMTAAIALSQRGLQPAIVELGSVFSPGGTGILIQDSPLRALDALDLVDAVQAHGYAHAHMNVCGMDGTIRMQNKYPSLLEGRPPSIAISRAELSEVLADRLQAEGVPVHFGLTAERFTERENDIEVAFSDGTRDTYDLVIGADGVHSQIRKLLFAESPKPDYTGQVIWRATAPRPSAITEYFMYLGPLSKVGFFPISDDRLYIFLVQASRIEPQRAEGDLRVRLRAELEPYGGFVPEIAAALDPVVDFRGVKSLMMPAPWHSSRVLLIGDAVHATTPHIGYGLGIAVEDAVVLADLLSSGTDIAAIFDEFMRRRFARCKLVVENSRQLGDWEQDPPADPGMYPALVRETLASLAQPI